MVVAWEPKTKTKMNKIDCVAVTIKVYFVAVMIKEPDRYSKVAPNKTQKNKGEIITLKKTFC